MTSVRDEARAQATRLSQQFGLSDPYILCERLGIDVIEGHLPPKVSGVIVKESGANATIVLSSQTLPVRRRFDCAHELGHYVERINVSGYDDFSFRDRTGMKYDLHEFFADEFAYELLMPTDEFLDLAATAQMTTLAAHFEVTVREVERRLRILREYAATSG